MNDSFAGVTYIATCDLGGICRGRAVPTAQEPRWAREGTGWVPSSLALSPLGRIVEGNAFGVIGDLRMIPDLSTRCEVPATETLPAFSLVLADLVTLDGVEWDCSSRTFLRHAIADLKEQTGLRLRAAFEHEFTLLDQPKTSAPLSLQALRRAEPFGSELVRNLEQCGLEPETWHPEYGPDQWEITVAAADAAVAADRAILVREVARHVAEAHGHSITFSPTPALGPVGNGVHVHMSLRNEDGSACMADQAEPERLSGVAASFAAGVLRHASALIAITAASPVSALRLGPGHWSAAAARLGYRDREALLRVCSALQPAGSAPVDSLNVEYRAADATANPWLVLGVLIRAGLEGIQDRLILPEQDDRPTVADAATPEGSPPLPATLTQALDALNADSTVMGWFPPDLINTYLAIKTDEVAQAADQTVEELCTRYRALY